MNDPKAQVNPWMQLSLLGDDAWELKFRVGVCPLERHCQFQVEVYHCQTGDLVEMVSIHHAGDGEMWHNYDRMSNTFAALLAKYIGPFD